MDKSLKFNLFSNIHTQRISEEGNLLYISICKNFANKGSMSDTSNKIAGLTLSDQLGEELRQAENPFALVVVCFVYAK